MSLINALLRPNSVAIIGASNDKTRIGGRPIHYLREAGFPGAIYPINPSRDEIQGLRAYASVEDVAGPIDCAIIATPASTVLAVVRSCAKKGVKAVVVLTAGFAEMGETGRQLQDEMAEIAREHGFRIIGPNCLGMFNTASKAFLSFSGACEAVIGTEGRVGLVSQSGGYAGDVVSQASHMGLYFGSWITTGNEADVEAGEIIGAFAQDDDIDVILAYLEGARDGKALVEGLAAARARRKPVVVIKAGSSQEGALAVAAHTASLAGSDSVYDAVFDRYGAYRARTTEEMLDIAYVASRGPFPAGNRLAVLTLSGGVGILAADYAKSDGLQMPPLPEEACAEILAMMPNAGARNPIDLTAQPTQEPELCARALEVALATGQFDMAFLNLGMLGGMVYAVDRLVDSLAHVTARYPLIPIVIGTMVPPGIAARYEQAGLFVFVEPARALHALRGLYYFSQAWSRALPATPQFSQPMPEIASDRLLNEAEAKRIIETAGIPVPQEFLVRTGAEAVDAARRIGEPVAIKVVSPDLLHKTEVGGVALDVALIDVGDRVDAMEASVRTLAPNAHLDGFLITPMMRAGVECFVGTHVDPVFGVTVTFGLGGTTVELYRDVTSRIVPIDLITAREMIDATQGAALLHGYRGRPKADVEAVADAIVRLAALAQANLGRIGTIEVNPLLAFEEGKGVIALDAVITR